MRYSELDPIWLAKEVPGGAGGRYFYSFLPYLDRSFLNQLKHREGIAFVFVDSPFKGVLIPDSDSNYYMLGIYFSEAAGTLAPPDFNSAGHENDVVDATSFAARTTANVDFICFDDSSRLAANSVLIRYTCRRAVYAESGRQSRSTTTR